MVTKLIDIANRNILLQLFIKIFCYIVFRIVDIWNEITGWLRSVGIGGKTYRSLKKYKNVHQGKRCFIIAMGSSLTIEDLELLKDEITFGMNSIVKVFEKTDFRPTYYGIQDHLVYADLEKEILTSYKEAENIFVSDRIKWHFKIGNHWNVFPLNMSYHAYQRWFHKRFYAKFSDDIYRRVYSGFSITYSLIEIAVYMGVTEIYLIGADCNFDINKKNHFVEHNVVDASLDNSNERNIAGYMAAKKYADANNIKIYNATRGGRLEVFERVNVDEMMGS